MVKKTIKSEALELAKAHSEFDPQTLLILYFQSKKEEEVRLLEVSSDVLPSGLVFPLTFAPDKKEGMQYPCTIIVVSQEDYEKIRQGDLTLPDDWGKLEDGEELFKKTEMLEEASKD